jgi:hypothetical protein
MNTETSLPASPTTYRKGTRFVSFYSTTEAPTAFLQVEHKSETAAQKGSWQSSAMKAIWIYRGYVAV